MKSGLLTDERTSGLLLIFELIKNGYLPIMIKKEEWAKYYDVLDLAHTTMDYASFIKLAAQLKLESEKLWLSVLE